MRRDWTRRECLRTGEGLYAEAGAELNDFPLPFRAEEQKVGLSGLGAHYLAEPEGRVHFAVEHTTVWPGWMEGALHSGLRAAREIAEPCGSSSSRSLLSSARLAAPDTVAPGDFSS